MSLQKIMGSLGAYEVIETEDGTQTLYSPEFQENCHSTAGATQETLYNYILGTNLLEKAVNQEKINILEVGFATGLGLKVTLESLHEKKSENSLMLEELNFISTELDELITLHFLRKLEEEGLIKNIQVVSENTLKYVQGEFIWPRGKVRVLLGNARETILALQNSSFFMEFDCFYHDPFSPKKNPYLWTKEFFKDLKSIATPNAILSTYSSTKAVWKAMMVSGWRVQEVKGYGNKKLSTRAYSTGESSQFVLDQCKRSPTEALSDSRLL